MLVGASAAMSMPALGQGTLEDYNRAYGLRNRYGIHKTSNLYVNPMWIGDTHMFWYVDQTPEKSVYTMVDADKRTKKALFDHNTLASKLTAAGQQAEADKLNLGRLHVSDNLDTLRFALNGHNWTYLSKKGVLTDNGAIPPMPEQPHWMVVDEEKGDYRIPSPDGTKEAYVKDDNIFVRDLSTGKETQLTKDGTIGNYYSAYLQWSPDSKKVATTKIRPVEKRYVYYVEAAPDDQFQPKLHKQEYAKPGDELRFKHPVIVNVETGKVTLPDTKLFDKQYEISFPEWNADSEAITFDYNQRGHQVYRVLEVSADNGDVRTLVEETSDKYVNYPRVWKHYLSDGKRMIWSSERDNYQHLYMIDREGKQAPKQITKGPWYVRQVISVNEPEQKIYFTANGVEPDLDPYFIRYYSINFDGTGLTDLTPAAGTHRAAFSKDFKYNVDNYSSVTEVPKVVLRDGKTGQELMKVAEGDISALIADGWKAPEVFVAPGRDGKTPMWGNVYRPYNYDPNKTYPIIEYIYQGPGDQYVPKAFQPFNGFMQDMAELGFVVVQVDGMGTSFRSREFENICYKNLVDAGLPDHIAWIKALAQKYPNLDIDRVGIFGCSAGGQESTTAVLHHPEFYKAAYSACGCHDNRMDKIWWNEQWMGYPIDESYEKSSNIVNAHKLQVPLMLVVGELDDNVDPASTMKVVAELQKHNKDFELVVIPGAHHTMGEAFGDHKRYDFFVKHLMNVNPPKWDEITYPNSRR